MLHSRLTCIFDLVHSSVRVPDVLTASDYRLRRFGSEMFLIIEGTVAISAKGKLLGLLHAGGIFGEECVINKDHARVKRVRQAAAITHTDLTFLTRDTVQLMCEVRRCPRVVAQAGEPRRLLCRVASPRLEFTCQAWVETSESISTDVRRSFTPCSRTVCWSLRRRDRFCGCGVIKNRTQPSDRRTRPRMQAAVRFQRTFFLVVCCLCRFSPTCRSQPSNRISPQKTSTQWAAWLQPWKQTAAATVAAAAAVAAAIAVAVAVTRTNPQVPRRAMGNTPPATHRLRTYRPWPRKRF